MDAVMHGDHPKGPPGLGSSRTHRRRVLRQRALRAHRHLALSVSNLALHLDRCCPSCTASIRQQIDHMRWRSAGASGGQFGASSAGSGGGLSKEEKQSQEEQSKAHRAISCDSAGCIDLEQREPLLCDNPQRWALHPIQCPGVWELYKEREASYWTAEEINLSQDMADWEGFTDAERHFIKYTLVYSAAFDTIEQKKLAAHFSTELPLPEARCFYDLQEAMTNVHAETYSLMIEHYIHDPVEKEAIFAAINTMPSIHAKASWADQWMQTSNSFAEQVVVLAAFEGILLSGSFCAICWIKERGLMPGMTVSSEQISHDADLHAEFACLIYGMLQHRLPEDIVHDIISSAVEVECSFICEALSCDLIGMRTEMMTEYIKLNADRISMSLGYSQLYGASNPFDWLEPEPDSHDDLELDEDEVK